MLPPTEQSGSSTDVGQVALADGAGEAASGAGQSAEAAGAGQVHIKLEPGQESCVYFKN